MPKDETRKLLKLFGVAVTELEDAVDRSAPAEQIAAAGGEAKRRLGELNALIDSLAQQRSQAREKAF